MSKKTQKIGTLSVFRFAHNFTSKTLGAFLKFANLRHYQYQCMRRASCASSVASVSPLGGDARSQSSPHGPDQVGQKCLGDGAPDVAEGLLMLLAVL